MKKSWERSDAMVRAKAHLAGYMYVSDQDRKAVEEYYLSGRDQKKPKNYPCQWCSRVYAGQEYLDNHVKEWHKDQLQEAQAPQPGSSSKSANGEKHKNKRLCRKFGISREAAMCIPKLPTPTSSEEEMQVAKEGQAIGGGAWNCTTCGVSFATRRYFRKHCKRAMHIHEVKN